MRSFVPKKILVPTDLSEASNILRVAQEVRPDIIVMGGRRRVMLFGEFFSTTTEKVMRAAATSLLVVPMKDVEE